MVKSSFARLHRLEYTQFMAAKGTSSSSFNIEECDFSKLNLSKISYLVLFSCMNYHLTTKYKTEKLIAK